MPLYSWETLTTESEAIGRSLFFVRVKLCYGHFVYCFSVLVGLYPDCSKIVDQLLAQGMHEVLFNNDQLRWSMERRMVLNGFVGRFRFFAVL